MWRINRCLKLGTLGLRMGLGVEGCFFVALFGFGLVFFDDDDDASRKKRDKFCCCQCMARKLFLG